MRGGWDNRCWKSETRRELGKTASRPPKEECVALASLDTELSSSVPIPVGSCDEVS